MATFLILTIVMTMIQFDHVSSCVTQHSNKEDSVQESIHITFSPPIPPNKYAFAEIPITYDGAVKAGYKEMPKNANYKGARFIRDNDASNILIFSENKPKKFVGFQIQFPVSGVKKQTKWMKWFDVQPMFNVENRDGEKYYAATFYVVDPDTIDSDKPMTCDRLACEIYFQNGPTADTVLKAPMETDQVQKPWVEGKCVPQMGHHYWLNITKDADCMQDVAPFFIMHINNKFSGVGINFFANIQSSPRFEHPPFIPQAFFNEWPDCLEKMYNDVGGISSLHIYFNENPALFVCIG